MWSFDSFASLCRAWLGPVKLKASSSVPNNPESELAPEAIAPTSGTYVKYNSGKAFADLLELAAGIAKTPVSCLLFPNAERQFIFSPTNLDADSRTRYSIVCMQMIHDNKTPSSPIIIEDFAKHPYGASIPKIHAEPAIRALVALPLPSNPHEGTGYLFLIDHEPRVRDSLFVDQLSLVVLQISEYIQMCKHLADIEESIDAYQIAERRWMTQYEVTQILAESDSLSHATPRLLQVVCNGLDWEVGLLWKVDDSARVLRCVELWNKPTVSLPKFTKLSFEISFASGIGLPGRVWFSRDSRWIPDVTRDSNFPRMQAAQEEGLHGAFGFPIQWNKNVLGVLEFFSHDIRQPDETLLKHFTAIGNQIGQFAERKRVEREQEDLIQKLKDAFSEVKTLSGLLPICASCKKVRDDKGYWHQIEKYIERHSKAEVSHGLCRECARKLYPEYYKNVE